MAIFHIEDSTLNSYLNEHGGAHRKYAELQQAKANYHDNEAKNLNNTINDPNTSIKNVVKAQDQKRDHLNKASDYQDKADSYNTSATAQDYNKAKQQGKTSAMSIYQKAGANMKKDFQSKFGGPSSNTNNNTNNKRTYLNN